MASDVEATGVKGDKRPCTTPSTGRQSNDSEEYLQLEGPPYSLGERHVDAENATPLSEVQKEECARAIRSASLFRFCSDESIAKVVGYMRREEFSEGEVR